MLSTIVVIGSLLFRFGYTESADTSTVVPEEQLEKLKTKTAPITQVLSAQNLASATKDIGVYLNSGPGNQFRDYSAFERILGYKLDYILFFHAWGDRDAPFPIEYIENVKRMQVTPIFTWEPWRRNFSDPSAPQPSFSLQTIIDGEHDEYISSWARSAAEADIRMIIRFAHEMNTTPGAKSWYPWQGEPDNYIAAFRHVVGIFDAAGADKVEFLWNPINWRTAGSHFLYYPGDAYVDWIGLTIINFGTVLGTNGQLNVWNDCKFLLQSQYRAAEPFNKPIILAETLTTDFGGSKADWFTDCIREASSLPRIRAMVFYHSNDDKDRWTELKIDWRITDDPEVLEAIRTAIRRYWI